MTDFDAEMAARAEEARKAAEDERPTTPPAGESEDDYYARVKSVPGVFGDFNTRASAPAPIVVEEVIPVDVPSIEISADDPAPAPEPEPVPEEPAQETPAEDQADTAKKK